MSEPPSISTPGRRAFWTRWTLVWIVCWVSLFVVTHTPMPKGAHLPFRFADKVVHFGIYFTLALLGGRAAFSRRAVLTSRWVWTWAVIYALYGAADELLQPLVGRNDSITDWLADVLGALAGLGVVYLNRPGPNVYEPSDESSSACPRCRRANARGARYCATCGQTLEIVTDRLQSCPLDRVE